LEFFFHFIKEEDFYDNNNNANIKNDLYYLVSEDAFFEDFYNNNALEELEKIECFQNFWTFIELPALLNRTKTL